jgi:succinoglycan biosynthesis transport protein ExoP
MSATNTTGIERVRELVARRFGLGAITAALVLTVAAGAILGLRDVYRATSMVVVDPGPGAGEGLPAELEARLQVIGQQILSRPSVVEMLDRFDLYHELRGRVPEQVVLQRFRNDVVVDRKEAQEPGGRGRTVAFTVTYQSGDRSKVAGVSNALAEAYVRQDVRERRAAAEAVGGELEHVRRQLDEQERRLGAFRARHGGMLPEQADSNASALDRTNADLRSASENRLRAMERRSALLKQLADADPGVSGDADATAARVARLNQELAELRRSYTDRYPDVERVKAEIAAVEAQSKEARQQPRQEPATGTSALTPLKEALNDAEQEIAQLRNQEVALRRRTEDYRQQVEVAPATGQALLEMSRDYETTKALYTSVLRRFEEARLAAGSGTEALPGRGFRLLEAALPPAVPVGPPRGRLLMMALALAIAAGVAVSFVAEQLDATFRSVDDLRGFTRVPVLVAIPEVLTRRERRGRWLLRSAAVAAVLLVAVVLGHASYRVAHGDAAIPGVGWRVS